MVSIDGLAIDMGGDEEEVAAVERVAELPASSEGEVVGADELPPSSAQPDEPGRSQGTEQPDEPARDVVFESPAH